MQLRWVFNTKNTYDIVTDVNNSIASRLDDLFRRKANGDQLTASDINALNRNALQSTSSKNLGDLIKMAPSFEVPIYPSNVSMSYKDIELYIREDKSSSWICVYRKKSFDQNAFNTFFKIVPPNIEEIKSNILAQIDELLKH